MTRRNEPALWTNTRTDPAAYADGALAELLGAIAIPDAQLRGYIHDALLLAFEAGEDQGECRAVRILAIARANASSTAARTAIKAALTVLMGEGNDGPSHH
jgi:hypothetical protein